MVRLGVVALDCSNPALPEVFEPLHLNLQRPQGVRLQPVVAVRVIRPHGDPVFIEEDGEVPSDCAAGDGELVPDDGRDVAGGVFAARKDLHNPPSHRFGHELERMHSPLLFLSGATNGTADEYGGERSMPAAWEEKRPIQPRYFQTQMPLPADTGRDHPESMVRASADV